jgi:hypothetical protein
MNIGAASPASTSPFVDNKFVSSSTAPVQSSPTNSTASSLPLTQEVGGSTDHTFTASTTDHELNAVTTPNPVGSPSAQQPPANNAPPDSLAQSGIGLHVSSAQ